MQIQFRVQNITDKATNIANTTSNSFVTVSIVKYASNPYNPKFYDPSPVNVKIGTTIAWINNDPTIHTITEKKGNNNTNHTSVSNELAMSGYNYCQKKPIEC
jgi:plastocyanin